MLPERNEARWSGGYFMNKHMILGVHITDRMKRSGEVQKLFSEYGCHIKTRIGLHEVSENLCSPNGMILLELFGDEKACRELETKLGAIEGVEVKKMVFSHR
jgi:hypothetical protein